MLGYGEEVEIETTGLPAGKVWFVLQPSGLEHYQPDPAPIPTPTNRWIGQVWAGDEGDGGKRFTLHVVVASDPADRAFRDYLARASTTNQYPGFPALPGGAQSIASFTFVRR